MAEQESADEVQAVHGLLTTSAQDRHMDFLSMSADLGAITSPDFAVDYGRTNRLLSPPVRRIDLNVLQKGEDLIAVFGQVRRETFVVGIGAGPLQ